VRSETPVDVAAREAELALAHAAAQGDPIAIAAFEAEIMPTARAVLARYQRDAVLRDELAQQLRVHLLVGDGAPPRLARFDGRAPLAAWVAMCATRLALHALRAGRARAGVELEWSDAVGELVAADPMFDRWRAAWAPEVAAALRDACHELSRRHRAVVRMVFVDGASTEEIAAAYRVHRVTVWRWVQEAEAHLREGVRRRLGAAGALPPDELVALVDDQVMLSLDRVLAPTETDVRPRAV